MFADSFCDSGWSNRSHRGWTTLVSFGLQALAVGCLLLLPLLYTQGLPRLMLLSPVLAPEPPAATPPAPLHANSSSTARSNMMGNRLVTPSEVPRSVTILTETVAPPPMLDPGAIGVSHGTGDYRGTVFGSTPGSDLAQPPPSPPVVHRAPPSRMMEGNLILRVQPDYPTIARQARVQGQVVLRAMISREGTIENLQVLSGHSMLVRAAVNAVQQWRYRPYVLNGEPIEVETEVKVNFVLSGG
jgi:periplasmic protein TonB